MDRPDLPNVDTNCLSLSPRLVPSKSNIMHHRTTTEAPTLGKHIQRSGITMTLLVMAGMNWFASSRKEGDRGSANKGNGKRERLGEKGREMERGERRGEAEVRGGSWVRLGVCSPKCGPANGERVDVQMGSFENPPGSGRPQLGLRLCVDALAS